MRTYKVEGDDLVESETPAVVLSRQARMDEAEAAFDAHYAHGGGGQADAVWRRIAIRYGVADLDVEQGPRLVPVPS